MPTPPLEEPTKKVTLNIWERDFLYLKAKYEHWSEKAREIIRDYVQSDSDRGRRR
jgi:hypothetical protein